MAIVTECDRKDIGIVAAQFTDEFTIRHCAKAESTVQFSASEKRTAWIEGQRPAPWLVRIPARCFDVSVNVVDASRRVARCVGEITAIGAEGDTPYRVDAISE